MLEIAAGERFPSRDVRPSERPDVPVAIQGGSGERLEDAQLALGHLRAPLAGVFGYDGPAQVRCVTLVALRVLVFLMVGQHKRGILFFQEATDASQLLLRSRQQVLVAHLQESLLTHKGPGFLRRGKVPLPPAGQRIHMLGSKERLPIG